MSRISIEVTPDQHNAIKAMALLEKVNMREFVISRLFGNMPKGKKPNARLMAALNESLNMKITKRYETAKDVFDRYR